MSARVSRACSSAALESSLSQPWNVLKDLDDFICSIDENARIWILSLNDSQCDTQLIAWRDGYLMCEEPVVEGTI